ncbi:hypothetical protein Kpol_1056p7 [Vanderwaltozyma polyspora DSM 70294]|uniref:DNA primase large subunit n=1 Tax=Vanderwaltozyma polyspora (strain ATCC 22028 / DSM 70294 / BCRC 21397 / CBS 2163 / NBRC 10782 / NRRL Y-8283 / UCD 57-17) TaxID=436907 RepID=A7TLL5_VANPO|nr:uncharacterized protein Kpol_1056p7 [Vanderwaltozyma polyspora DSM 70294]EDO16807.1 hypothetical protein Kpol_1056p7 [Vanderwaltozyma polyspora DSM 70294]
MFRQSRKRIANRRNFDSNELKSDGSSTQLIFNSGLLNEDERKLYEKIYDSKISFYELPPQGEITLDQFETWAIDRLKVLLEIESCISRNKSIKEIEIIIKPLLQKYLPLNADSLDDKKKDYYSHYILRLCFCRSKELRDKFVRAETLLFKLRYTMLTSTDQSKFVNSLNLPLLQFISQEEKKELSQQLFTTISPALQFQLNLTDDQQRRQFFQQEKFIKLPFENVIDLVGSRQVFLKNGYAYLPQFQQLNLLSTEFSNKLSDELMKTYQFLPRLNEDDRLIPILHHLSSGYSIADFQSSQQFNSSNEDNEINAKSVYSKEISECYPLCVKNLMDGLNETHHLRYNGRQQLSFFLKGIGLSCDEAMNFWTDAFTTKGGHLTVDKFNKEYRYNFRHNYGLEGNRINYKPWDCRTILSKPRPARGEFHGCPYRDWTEEKLSSELNKLNLSNHAITSVLDSCKKNEYTFACTKVFEETHPGIENQSNASENTDASSHIAHPNLYFDRARQWQKKHKKDN